LDPIKRELGYRDHEMIQKKMLGNSNMFIFSSTVLSERQLKPKQNQSLQGLYFEDVTQYYCEKWAKVLISRKQISLRYWWDDTVKVLRHSPGRLKSRKLK
jgi:hypothetical protein